jgi:hypothetical protein
MGSGSGSTAGTTGSGSTGSGTAAAGTQRVDGEIESVDAGNRTVRVQNLTLQLDPSSMILVDCRQASPAELKEGTKAKVQFQQKDGQNVVTVIEASRS